MLCFSIFVVLLALAKCTLVTLPDGFVCDCDQLVRARDVQVDSGNWSPTINPTPDDVHCLQDDLGPAPTLQCNEPIDPRYPDLRGVYGNPQTQDAFFMVSQCGNLIEFRLLPSAPNAVRFVDSARPVQLGDYGEYVLDGGYVQPKNDATTACVAGVGVAAVLSNTSVGLIRAYAVDTATTAAPQGLQILSAATVPFPQPGGGIVMLSGIASVILSNGAPQQGFVPQLAPPPTSQYLPEGCFSECPDPEPSLEVVLCSDEDSSSSSSSSGSSSSSSSDSEPTSRCFGSSPVDFPRARTPCYDVLVGFNPDGSIYENYTCGFSGSVPLVLDGCTAHIPHSIPDFRGTWAMSDNSTMRFEQCGNRVVYAHDNFIRDFYVDSPARRDGLTDIERPNIDDSESSLRQAIYMASSPDDSTIVLRELISPNTVTKTLRVVSSHGSSHPRLDVSIYNWRTDSFDDASGYRV